MPAPLTTAFLLAAFVLVGLDGQGADIVAVVYAQLALLHEIVMRVALWRAAGRSSDGLG